MSDGKFKYDSVQDAATLKKYLQALLEGFDSGAIHLTYKGEEIVVEPKGLINFQLEAKVKGEQRKLALKFTWRDTEDDDTEEIPLEMKAGS